jgi:hypothetical protein
LVRRRFPHVLKILNFRSRISKMVAGIGGTVAAVLSLVLGVHEARQSSTPTVQPRTNIAAGQWLVSLNSVTVGDRLPDGRGLPPGQRAITVDATVTNWTYSSSSNFQSVVRLVAPSLDSRVKPTFYLVRDAVLLDQLHPGLPERVAIVWIAPASAIPHSPITLEVEAKSYKSRDNLYAAPGWFNPEVVGTVTLMPTRIETSRT